MTKEIHPIEAMKRHPGMSGYDAFALEIDKTRSKMIGLRITEDDMKVLQDFAKEKRATVTQIAYLLLHKKILEYWITPSIPGVSEIKNRTTGNEEIVSEQLRWEILERDDFRCKKCGSRRFLHVDHIHPRSKGGRAIKKNLQTLCRSCNIKKGNRI